MKKFILSAVAAGSLAFAGAASAQTFGGFLDQLFGYGTYDRGTPAVVAGAGNQGSYTYVDQYGRTVQVDAYGRHTIVNNTTVYGNPGTIVGYDQWGRPVYGNSNTVIGYDQWGRAVYGNSTYGNSTYGTYGNNSHSGGYWDRDGDGIANAQDRWPDDRRYW